MTDGESLVDAELTIPEADAARAAGIILFAMGIGPNLKDVELQVNQHLDFQYGILTLFPHCHVLTVHQEDTPRW